MQGRSSRYDRRFYAIGLAVLGVTIAGKALGADAFSEYPTTEIGTGPATLVVAGCVALSGLAPLRRRPGRSQRELRFVRNAHTTELGPGAPSV